MQLPDTFATIKQHENKTDSWNNKRKEEDKVKSWHFSTSTSISTSCCFKFYFISSSYRQTVKQSNKLTAEVWFGLVFGSSKEKGSNNCSY